MDPVRLDLDENNPFVDHLEAGGIGRLAAYLEACGDVGDYVDDDLTTM